MGIEPMTLVLLVIALPAELQPPTKIRDVHFSGKMLQNRVPSF